MGHVFMTGATGFLGRYLLERLLADGTSVVLLGRGDPAQARQRVQRLGEWLGGDAPERIGEQTRIVGGDLAQPRLGLSKGDERYVTAHCSRILHCAATVRFDLPLDAARSINVAGTRRILDLAGRMHAAGGLDRVDHISTAFVAGRRSDVIVEGDLDDRAGFRNTYEQTKFEAERLVAGAGLPATIYRPSIIVGESGSGRTSSFSAFYTPVKIYARGWWRLAPAHRETPIDLVPVDVAAAAIAAIARRPGAVGGTFHIAAGTERDTTFGDIIDVLHGFFPDRRPIRCVDPDRWIRFARPLLRLLSIGTLRRVMHRGRYFVPYLAANPRFDTSAADALLTQDGIEIPKSLSYLAGLLSYGAATDWGRAGDQAPADGGS